MDIPLCYHPILNTTKRYKLKDYIKNLILGLPIKLVGKKKLILTGYICKDCQSVLKRRKSLRDNLQKVEEDLYVKIHTTERSEKMWYIPLAACVLPENESKV